MNALKFLKEGLLLEDRRLFADPCDVNDKCVEIRRNSIVKESSMLILIGSCSRRLIIQKILTRDYDKTDIFVFCCLVSTHADPSDLIILYFCYKKSNVHRLRLFLFNIFLNVIDVLDLFFSV